MNIHICLCAQIGKGSLFKELAVLGADNKIDQDAQFGQVCMRPRMWRVCSAFVAHVSRA